MIDARRLEANLIAVARHYAPSLIPSDWHAPGDYPRPLTELAGALAGNNILVIGADLGAAGISDPTVSLWVDAYLDFYRLLTERLFPSFPKISAFYIDQASPVLIGIQGDCIPVIEMLAGAIAPYTAARQGTQPPAIELRGIVYSLLDELEAGDLPHDEQTILRERSIESLRQMLTLPVSPVAITPPMLAILNDLQPVVKASTPPINAPPPLPTSLPEAPTAPATLPEAPRRPDADVVPFFFNPQRPNDEDSRRPPTVPPPPTGDLPR